MEICRCVLAHHDTAARTKHEVARLTFSQTARNSKSHTNQWWRDMRVSLYGPLGVREAKRDSGISQIRGYITVLK